GLQGAQPHRLTCLCSRPPAHVDAIDFDAGIAQATCPRSRHSSATPVSTKAPSARQGWIGANHVIAPVYPRASNAILLQTGPPTANQASTVPAMPNRLLRRSRRGVSEASVASGPSPASVAEP